jgi:hypothetical protein
MMRAQGMFQGARATAHLRNQLPQLLNTPLAHGDRGALGQCVGVTDGVSANTSSLGTYFIVRDGASCVGEPRRVRSLPAGADVGAAAVLRQVGAIHHPSHGPSPQNISASTASGQATRFLAAAAAASAAAASAAAASEAASAAAAAEAMTTETAAPPVQLTALSRRVSWRSSFRESTSTLHPHSQSGTRRHTPRRCCDSTACE